MSNQGHTYFQPFEYDQMLIAAGWVTVERLDDDYQEHVRKQGRFDSLDYPLWVQTKREWDAANEAYCREFEPDGRPVLDEQLTPRQSEEMRRLLNEMSRCEWMLGY